MMYICYYLFLSIVHKKSYSLVIGKLTSSPKEGILRLNKDILYTKRLSKGTLATQSVNEMKCTNEKRTRNTQDTNLSWYVPNANVDHTVRGQGTNTLDHSTTTPRSCLNLNLKTSIASYRISWMGFPWWFSHTSCVIWPIHELLITSQLT